VTDYADARYAFTCYHAWRLAPKLTMADGRSQTLDMSGLFRISALAKRWSSE